MPFRIGFFLWLVVLFPASAQALTECKFKFDIDAQSSAFHAMVDGARERGGFWRPIREAPDDVQAIGAFIGRLDICLVTPDGKPRTLTVQGQSRELQSPHVTSCTAALLPGNRLLTNSHCFFSPTLSDIGFSIVQEARVNFGYVDKDFTDNVTTFLVSNRELAETKDQDALVLQIVGADANDVLGGHLPMVMQPGSAARRALTMIHHPRGEPQQFSAGTCQIHEAQADLPETASQLRHSCESAGGSSGSLLLDARSLAVVGLHNQGGLGPRGGFNGGHKIEAIEAALALGFVTVSDDTPEPDTTGDPAILAFAALTQALQASDLDARRQALETVISDFPKTDAAKSAESVLALMVSPVQVDTSPVTLTSKTLKVAADGSGDFQTISAAIAAAAPGAVIEIHAGFYDESIRVSHPLELVGIGDRADITWIATESDIVYWTASSGRIANLRLEQINGEGYGLVFDEGAQAVVEGNDLTSLGKAVVTIANGSTPIVRNNVIRDGSSHGVLIRDAGRGELINNQIYGHSESGVVVMGGSNPVLRNNTIRNNRKSGIYVLDDATGQFDGNEISDNTEFGVSIKTGADPEFRDNTIQGGAGAGLYVRENGRGTFQGNTIFGSAKSGVMVRTSGNPLLRENIIRDSKSYGIVVFENGRGTFEGNEIYATTKAGVLVQTGGDPVLRGNIFRNGEATGAMIRDEGRGTFEGNEFSGFSHPGVMVKTGADPVFRSNVIMDGDQSGVFVLGDGRGVYEENVISGNMGSGVSVKTGGAPVFRNNIVNDNGEYGAWIRDGGAGRFEGNDLRYNNRGAFDIEADAGSVDRRNNQE